MLQNILCCVLVPLQENGYDCGVFVCPYAAAMYYLQDVEVSYTDIISENPPFMSKLSLSPYFDFNQSDIDKFHAELLLLIKMLISLYSTRTKVHMKTRGYEQNIMSGTEAVTTDATISAEAATGATLTLLISAVEDTVLHELLQEDDNVDDNADDAEGNAAIKSEVEETVHAKVAAEDEIVTGALYEQLSVETGRELITIGPNSESVVKSMRESFYQVYNEHFESVKGGGTTVMTRAMYDTKVQLHIDANSERYKGKTKPQKMQNALSRFTLIGQVPGSQLYQQTKEHPSKVPYLEILFDIIHDAHLFLGHPKDCRVTKVHIDGWWWGIPENAVKVYRNLCPPCLRHSCPPAAESLQPLRMIISDTIGSRCQMDLIDYTRRLDMNRDGVFTLILRYVDHFSGFSQLAALKDKSSKSVGNALIRILSSAVLPEVLQSDNGKEFLGYCIQMLKEEFHTIKVVKGRAYHPESQGSVERGNATFKEALDKWLEEEDNKEAGAKRKGWSEVGIYVVNAQINSRPSQSKDKKVRMKYFMVRSPTVQLPTLWTITYYTMQRQSILFR